MMYYSIVPAVFFYFFKDLNMLPAVLFMITYRLPNSSYGKSKLSLAFSKLILKSYQLELQYSYQHGFVVNS